MTKDVYLETLKAKHAKLEEQINQLLPHATLHDDEIHELKRQKLKIKDEIERLQQQSKGTA